MPTLKIPKIFHQVVSLSNLTCRHQRDSPNLGQTAWPNNYVNFADPTWGRSLSRPDGPTQ